MAPTNQPRTPPMQESLFPGFSATTPITTDPSFQPPRDLLRDVNATRKRAVVINREIPNVTIQSGWDIADVRAACVDLVSGRFDRPAQLHDALAGDSRVQSALKQRSGALLGKPVRFKLPQRYRKDSQAKKCLRAWERHWPQMGAEPALLDLLETSHGLGFSTAQCLWDTSREIWKPHLLTFNSRYTYYHWLYRVHVAVTQDGQSPITGGDGGWVLHAPYGSYRGWMRGSLRAVAQWWLARQYALRDWARYCEKHGFPLLIADTPFGADPNDIASLQADLGTLGQESILQVPGSVDVQKYGRYDLRYLEPKDASWQAFKALIEQCNDEITLALLGQNLTTQVKEGSLAAARVHADVRQAIVEADARALARTLYLQVARPFAAINFGNPDLAPLVSWDVRPPEDFETKARTFGSFATALNQLRSSGFALNNPERFASKFGLHGLSLREVPPVQIEAQLARATGEVSTHDKPMPTSSDDADDSGDKDPNDDDADEKQDDGDENE